MSVPLPGLRCRDLPDWLALQQRHRQGEILSPLLPLGDDAAYIWVPKNGCTTLKRAWLQLRNAEAPPAGHLDLHGAALAFSHWLTPAELQEVSTHRRLVAIWRDPIDRFVSACRSHLVELTTGRIHTRLLAAASGDAAAYQANVAYHDELFRSNGVSSFADDCAPIAVMNAVALQLAGWSHCHIDWGHHTAPQVAFLGADPQMYTSILGMEEINALIRHWSAAAGVAIDAAPQHVSAVQGADDHWRRLQRGDLSAEAITALEQFYAADWAFITLAQQLLGAWQAA
jgi:hypothetical protein